MGDFSLIRDFVLTLMAALCGGVLARYLRQPPLLGFLVAGLLVGPSILGLVSGTSNIQLFAEFGIAFLMFNLGAGISLDQFKHGLGRAFLMAVLEVGLVVCSTVAASRLFGLSLAAALLVGVALAEASTAVVMKVAGARGDISNSHTRLAIAVSMGEDLVIIPIIAFLPLLASETRQGAAPLLSIAKSIGFLLVAVVVARLIVPWALERVAATSRELFLLGVVAAALALGGLFEAVGLSFTLGAFVAGFSLGGTHLSRDVQAEAVPFQEVFVALFFVTMGMTLDLRSVTAGPWLVVAFVSFTIVGRGLIGALVVKLFNYPGRASIMVGVYLGQIGDLSFVLATMGLQLGLITSDIASALVIAALVSIAVNPAVVGLVDRIRLRSYQVGMMKQGEPFRGEPFRGVSGLSGHVVLCGFTGVARSVAKRLEMEQVPYVVVDQASGALVNLRRARVPCVNGDAASPEVLRQARVPQASAVVVTMSDPATVLAVVARARKMNPHMTVVAVAEDPSQADLLQARGADTVVRADVQVGRLLEASLLGTLRRASEAPTSRDAGARVERARVRWQGARGDEHSAVEGGATPAGPRAWSARKALATLKWGPPAP